MRNGTADTAVLGAEGSLWALQRSCPAPFLSSHPIPDPSDLRPVKPQIHLEPEHPRCPVCCQLVCTHSVCGLCLASCSHPHSPQSALSAAAVTPPGHSCSVAFPPWAWLTWVGHLDPTLPQALTSPRGRGCVSLLAGSVTSFRSLQNCQFSPPLSPRTVGFLPDRISLDRAMSPARAVEAP